MQDGYEVDDYLEIVRQREAERRQEELRQHQELCRELERPRCKKCNYYRTTARTGICWRCTQEPYRRRHRRRVCKKCQRRMVNQPKFICWVCKAPERKRRQKLERKLATGRCIEDRCPNPAMPGSTTCIRHGGKAGAA